MQWAEFKCTALKWMWWASDSSLSKALLEITEIHRFKTSQWLVLFHRTVQILFQPVTTFSIHNNILWQGIPQFKQALSEELLLFYPSYIFPFMFLGIFYCDTIICCPLFTFTMLFTILQNLISFPWYLFRLERQSMLVDHSYENHYIILTILYCPLSVPFSVLLYSFCYGMTGIIPVIQDVSSPWICRVFQWCPPFISLLLL